MGLSLGMDLDAAQMQASTMMDEETEDDEADVEATA